jgi:DNA-binding PucR family transcriptional regulator
MYGYRIAYNLDPKLKEFISSRVFTAEFKELLGGELGITIEEFFKNNLNLTDTAAKLYIHRNTLLYRLDKINKCTGFDIKRFEDSWLFKLAWMIHKENSK